MKPLPNPTGKNASTNPKLLAPRDYQVGVYLIRPDEDTYTPLIPVTAGHNLTILERFARAYSLETGRPQPFTATEFRQDRTYRRPYLLALQTRGGRAAVGAVELWHTLRGSTCTWAYVHPFCRRHGLMSAVWPQLEANHPGFTILEPSGEPGWSFVVAMGMGGRTE